MLSNRIILFLSGAIPSIALGILFLLFSPIFDVKNPRTLGESVIEDGGFESTVLAVDALEPRGYWGSTGSRFSGDVPVTREDKHSGDYSLKISSGLSTAGYVYQYYNLGTDEYSYSLWYRGIGDAIGEVTTGWGPPVPYLSQKYNGQFGATLNLGRGTFPLDGQWHKASVVNSGGMQAYFLDG